MDSEPDGEVIMDRQTFSIAPSAFDLSLLPTEARAPGTPAFREAVSAFLRQQFENFGGRADILVDDQKIAVAWSPDASQFSPLAAILDKLQRGQRAEAIQLLELLQSRQPDDLDVLYNLGIALSDAGKLGAAERVLRRAIELDPHFVNALIALGVALSRQQKIAEALEVLETAVGLQPDNPWGRRNLGATLLKMERYEEAAEELGRAVELQREDQPSWLALGDALRLAGKAKEGERAYARAIALNPHNDFAEAARQGSTQLAQASFGNRASRTNRRDAIEHCRAAIETFSRKSKEEIQEIAFEIAVLGRSGFDLNSAETKHRLKSMAGEFTGLQLVCHLYVGFQIIDPSTEIGFDLSVEYEAAKAPSGDGG